VGKPGDDRFLTSSGSTAMARCLWRVAALWLGATLQFGWFAACSGASAHGLPQGSGERIVAGQVDKLEVANRGPRRSSPDASQCPVWVKSGHGGFNLRCPLYLRKRTFIAAVIRLSTGIRTKRLSERGIPRSDFLLSVLLSLTAYYCALPPAFLHSDLNFLRSLPCKPLALA
jgi:hypothetical protein